MKQERKMNFELLRIISMIMIVVFHYSDWGGLIGIQGNVTNRFIGDFLNIGGRLGVNLFVLISGYFLINSKFRLKKLIKLIFEVWCYSVGIAIICLVFNIGDISTKNIIKSFAPISYNMYWFATTYVAMYLLSPFINKLINNINKEQHKSLLIILMILVCIIPTFVFGANICSSNLIWFVFIYLIAAYIHKYDIEFTKKRRNYLYIAICTLLCMFGVSVLCFNLGDRISFLAGKENYLNEMHTFPMLILSVSLFMYFKNLNIGGNKIIEFFAKSSFAVYLIHINAILRVYLFKDILKLQNYYMANPLFLILYIVSTAIAIYIICTIIETARRKLIEEPIFRITKFDKKFNKIDEKINGFSV